MRVYAPRTLLTSRIERCVHYLMINLCVCLFFQHFVLYCSLLLQQQLAQLQKEKSEILKNLALYYFTFVDVMEFKVGDSNSLCIWFFLSVCLWAWSDLSLWTLIKRSAFTWTFFSFFFSLPQDHVCELLNTIDACQVFFDIVSITGQAMWAAFLFFLFCSSSSR